MISLKNKNIIITGASKGIGRQIAYSAADLGAFVIIGSRNQKDIDSVVSDINKKYNKSTSIGFELDISNEKSVINFFSKVKTKTDKLDVLINNAGITSDNLIVKMTANQWEEVINTNLNGSFFCCKEASKIMLRQRFGKIINISSIIGLIGNKGQTNYSASKAGILGLTKSLAKELSSRNITVNAINPGYIDTDMTNKLNDKQKEEFLKDIPLNRFGETIDISMLACYLSSDISNYITGQVINVDGGIAI